MNSKLQNVVSCFDYKLITIRWLLLLHLSLTCVPSSWAWRSAGYFKQSSPPPPKTFWNGKIVLQWQSVHTYAVTGLPLRGLRRIAEPVRSSQLQTILTVLNFHPLSG